MVKETIAGLDKYLLDISPKVVKKLKRESDLIVSVEDTKRLEIPNMKLLVPVGVDVYESLGDFRYKEQFFFTVRSKGGWAYLSVIIPEDGALNYAKNTGELLKYPWFTNEDSSFIFDKLQRGMFNATRYGRKICIKTPHPFLKD